MSTKRILVTGGAGFLGANLCRKLLAEDDASQIICMDNLCTGKVSNIEALCEHPRFSFRKHDIVDTLPDDLRVDEIYNLACPASPPAYQADPIKTTKTSVIGILHLLELARVNNAKLLQASTSEVYGEPVVHPQREDYRGNVNCIGIRACYDEGKRCAESLLFDYHRVYGTRIKVIRIFNTYGPFMDAADGRVVSNFIVQCLNGQDVTIYGDGSQTRSFCYVDDLLAGMVGMMASADSFTGPVNLGNPEEHTVADLARMIGKLLGRKVKIRFCPLPKDDPTQRRPDITKAMQYLDWHPKVSLSDGLCKTIAYFKTGKKV